jgi:integrase
MPAWATVTITLGAAAIAVAGTLLGTWFQLRHARREREDASRADPHVAASKLSNLSLHGLRHTHATIALRAGVHPKVVSERLGHASVAFTLDVYTDSLPDMQETAASLIAALVLEP